MPAHACLVSEVARKSVCVCVHPKTLKAVHMNVFKASTSTARQCFDYNSKQMYACYKEINFMVRILN